MRRLLKTIGGLIALAYCGGCSLAPDINDVSALDTTAVVRHIECEAQLALIVTIAENLVPLLSRSKADRVRAWLQEADGVAGLQKLRNLSIQQMYDLIEDGEKDAFNYLRSWEGVVIGLGFTFDISENNKNTGGVDFAFPLSIGSLSLKANATADKTRQNKKQFTVVTAVPLIMQSKACLSSANADATRGGPPTFSPTAEVRTVDGETVRNVVRTRVPNYLHPITGSIGMHDVWRTFAGIWHAGKPAQDRTASLPMRSIPKGASHRPLPGLLVYDKNENGYIQVLTFTTKFTGTLNPKIELASSNLKSASILSENTRTDKHELIVNLSAPSPAEIAKYRALPIGESLKSAEAIRRALEAGEAAVRAVGTAVASEVADQRRLLALERLSIGR